MIAHEVDHPSSRNTARAYELHVALLVVRHNALMTARRSDIFRVYIHTIWTKSRKKHNYDLIASIVVEIKRYHVHNAPLRHVEKWDHPSCTRWMVLIWQRSTVALGPSAPLTHHERDIHISSMLMTWNRPTLKSGRNTTPSIWTFHLVTRWKVQITNFFTMQYLRRHSARSSSPLR